MTGPAAGTDATPAPLAEVPQAQGSALPSPDETYDPGMFVPAATRDNYIAIIRDQSAVRGVEVDVIRGEMVEQFTLLHERQPLDGYDHLAAWLDGADLDAGVGPTGLQVLVGRAAESARRDPYQAVIGDQALVQQAVTSQQSADQAAAAAAVSPSVDPTSGLLPNPGPLPVPSDVTTVDPAVAEQQQAAAAQLDENSDVQPGDTPPTDASPSSDPPPVSSSPADAPAQDAPADTATPPASDTTSSSPAPSTSGKGSKSSGGSSS